jgi:hypothetical protein
MMMGNGRTFVSYGLMIGLIIVENSENSMELK